jgi:hypothetical protein
MEQVGHSLAVLGIRGDADAGGDGDGASADGDGLSHGVEDSVGDAGGLGAVVLVLDNDDEVADEEADGIDLTDAASDPLDGSEEHRGGPGRGGGVLAFEANGDDGDSGASET